MNEPLTAALRPDNPKYPAIVFEPGLRAQIANGLIRLGIGTAQTVTFITYILVFLSIVILPLLGLYLIIRRRASQHDFTNHQENE